MVADAGGSVHIERVGDCGRADADAAAIRQELNVCASVASGEHDVIISVSYIDLSGWTAIRRIKPNAVDGASNSKQTAGFAKSGILGRGGGVH